MRDFMTTVDENVQNDFTLEGNLVDRPREAEELLDLICAFAEFAGISNIATRQDRRIKLQWQLDAVLKKRFSYDIRRNMIAVISYSTGRDEAEVAEVVRGLNQALPRGMSARLLAEQVRNRDHGRKDAETEIEPWQRNKYSKKSKKKAAAESEGEWQALYTVNPNTFAWRRPRDARSEQRYRAILEDLKLLPRYRKARYARKRLKRDDLYSDGKSTLSLSFDVMDPFQSDHNIAPLPLNLKKLSSMLRHVSGEDDETFRPQDLAIPPRLKHYTLTFQKALELARQMDAEAERRGRSLNMTGRLIMECGTRQFFVRDGKSGDEVGEMTFGPLTHIVGQTGAGKSTLMLLMTFDLVRNYDQRVSYILPENGTLGRDLYDKLLALFDDEEVAFLHGGSPKSVIDAQRTIRSQNTNGSVPELIKRHPDRDPVSRCLLSACVDSTDAYQQAMDNGGDPLYGCGRIKLNGRSKDGESYSCPFVSKCHAYKDFMKVRRGKAKIYVMTPKALAQSAMPDLLAEQSEDDKLIAYHLSRVLTCGFIFADEVDKLNAILDEDSIEKSDIIGSRNAWELAIGDVLHHWRTHTTGHKKGLASYMSDHFLLKSASLSTLIAYREYAAEAEISKLSQAEFLKPYIGQPVVVYGLLQQLANGIHPEKADIEENEPELSHQINTALGANMAAFMDLVRENVTLRSDASSKERREAFKRPEHVIISELLDDPVSAFHDDETILGLLDLLSKDVFGFDVPQRLGEGDVELRFQAHLFAIMAITQVLYQRLTVSARGIPYTSLLKSLPKNLHLQIDQSMARGARVKPLEYLSADPADASRYRFTILENKGGDGFTLSCTRYVQSLRTGLERLPFHGGLHHGPNMVMLSGSSSLQASRQYHVKRAPDYLVAPNMDDAQAPQVKFKLAVTRDENEQAVKVSGAPHTERLRNLRAIMKNTCSHAQGNDIWATHNQVHQEWGQSGREVAFVLPSYESAIHVTADLSDAGGRPAVIMPRKRLEAEASFLRGHLGVPVDNLELLSEDKGQYDSIVAVMGGLARGVNLVEEETKESIIGTLVYPIRFHPPADSQDLEASLIAHFSHEATRAEVKGEEQWGTFIDELEMRQRRQISQLYAHDASPLSHPDPELAATFAADRLIDVLQMNGRGMRNNGKVLVVFSDAAWAPNSADNSADTARTSVLVAWIKVLLKQRKDNVFAHNYIFDPLLEQLLQTEGLKHNIKELAE